MPHYVALLRGINLGNRRMKMDDLRAHFEKFKLKDVSTFIASGNVIFQSQIADGRELGSRLQVYLAKRLGYPVDTFVRTRAELAAVAALRPFSKADQENPTHTIYAGFWQQEPPPAMARGLQECRSSVDEFRVQGLHYFWLCRVKSNESVVWSSPALRSLKLPTSTMRNMTTVRKLAALYPPPVD